MRGSFDDGSAQHRIHVLKWGITPTSQFWIGLVAEGSQRFHIGCVHAASMDLRATSCLLLYATPLLLVKWQAYPISLHDVRNISSSALISFCRYTCTAN